MVPDDDDRPNSGSRPGHRHEQKYSGRASIVAIAITIVIVGLIVYYRAKIVGL
jgi:hypothetical protein